LKLQEACWSKPKGSVKGGEEEGYVSGSHGYKMSSRARGAGGWGFGANEHAGVCGSGNN